MSNLYHGSANNGIKQLEPRRSTHGNYVYATPCREIAVIFSARHGDDFTYALYRNEENEPWTLVERIPEAFNTMFNNSSSIYTVDDKTFKDIHTGFVELVSDVAVDIINEEKLDNVYDEIKKLSNEGKIQLYNYPNKPKNFSSDNSDLIDKLIRHFQRTKREITKEHFERLVLLHPNLIDKVNQKMEELNLKVKPYQKEDLIDLFEKAVIRQAIYPGWEQNLKSSIISISNCYPDLLPTINEKYLFLDMAQDEKKQILIDKLPNMFLGIPSDLIEQAKEKYLSDNRTFSEIGKEIFDISNKIMLAEQAINNPIDQDIIDDSILLIGSNGVDKSTISKELSESTGLSVISLDDQEKLSKFYGHKSNFKNTKNFDFYLTSGVLSLIDEPSIIDFGANHFVYEDSIIFYEIQKLINRFKNVELILPSEDINNQTIEFSCNYELATDVVYVNDFTPDEVASEILTQIRNRKSK